MVQSSILPTHMGLESDQPPEPCFVVIFGATGDLTGRELVPSLYELWVKGLLPERFHVLGVARRSLSDTDFRAAMHEGVRRHASVDDAGWTEFAASLGYLSGDFDDPRTYAELRQRIHELAVARNIPENVMFHLATPPSAFEAIVARLGEAGLADETQGYRRVVIEKPFGTDRRTALALDDAVARVFKEHQTYRIDHFLGKETVQNMLVVRFANPAFEPIWNRSHVDHVQITVAENIGIGTRAEFYERTGVVRDMVQNHLLQLLCMCAIEPPGRFDGRLLRDETVKVLRALRPLDLERDCVRGQYGSGVGAEGAAAYRAEAKVNGRSATPTFAALRLWIDNWRWQGVPFYLRTGKRMARKTTEVTVQFKPTPHMIFDTRGGMATSNRITFRLQPHEGILQTFVAKRPGPHMTMDSVNMLFNYSEAFGVDKPPRAYAWLLRDVMEGDQTLFARSDWIEEAWRLIDPIITHWETAPPSDFPNYPAGTWGPAAAEDLLSRDGRAWHSSLS